MLKRGGVEGLRKPSSLTAIHIKDVVKALARRLQKAIKLTEQYGLMSSAYSLSQIVGGLVLGALSDRALSRRSVLLISFLGSALSYGTIGLSSSLTMLLVGRVVVGLVKQVDAWVRLLLNTRNYRLTCHHLPVIRLACALIPTQTQTISTAIVSEHTAKEERSAELSKLTAAMTFSSIVGTACGSFLYQRSKTLPPLVACALFLLNAALALILLPSGNGREVGSWTDAAAGAKKKDDDIVNGSDNKDDTLTTATPALDGGAGKSAGRGMDSSSSSSATRRFLANFKKACSSGPTLRILAAKLIFDFFFRALGSQNFVGYYEERFGVASASRGYMSSYTAGLSFLVQLYVVGRLASLGSETHLVAMSLAVVAFMNFAEGAPSIIGFWGYLALLIPARTVAHGTLQACLQSMFTQRVPQGDLGAALGVLNVLSSASGVVAPAYGGKLIGYLGILARPTVNAAHYAAFFVLWWVMEVARGGAPAEGEGGSRKPESVADGPVGEAAVDAGDGDSRSNKID
ncbi:unnamed protein product [Ectocarpus sp. CCAP 1310/34]|nr:unnamed protein product [Ectocarpus sp. CCAP 1310/34]